MPVMLLAKSYHEAADGLMPYVTHATREERTLTTPSGDPQQEIVIEGTLELFSLHLMDFWGGTLRFLLRDTEARDEKSQRERGFLAMQVPALANLMTAKTQMQVHKREVSHEHADGYEWRDVTQEFSDIITADTPFR